MLSLQYARYYDSIYNLPSTDRPDDDLIEDDEALDSWYANYVRSLAIKAAKMAGKAPKLDIDESLKHKAIAKFGG